MGKKVKAVNRAVRISERDLSYIERLLLLASNVLYTDMSGPAHAGLPGQGTT
jgi:hypothetical protein